jgi:hypothetical protein
MAVAQFDYSAWAAANPSLAGNVPAALASSYFATAGLYLDNSDASPVRDPAKRLILLNLVVSHLAALAGAGTADGKATGLVGRIKSATEGSVSVEVADVGGAGGGIGEAFWTQTPYGLQFWALTAPLRSFRYVPSRSSLGCRTARDYNNNLLPY